MFSHKTHEIGNITKYTFCLFLLISYSIYFIVLQTLRIFEIQLAPMWINDKFAKTISHKIQVIDSRRSIEFITLFTFTCSRIIYQKYLINIILFSISVHSQIQLLSYLREFQKTVHLTINS